MFLINSRLGHFSATLRRGHPFSRSYRVNLPSSLAMIHSSTLGSSPRLPVSDCGTGGIYISLEIFLGSMISVISDCPKTHCTVTFDKLCGFSCNAYIYGLQRTLPFVRRRFTPPSSHHYIHQYWNINQLSIGISLRISLRPRLTLIRLALIRKP